MARLVCQSTDRQDDGKCGARAERQRVVFGTSLLGQFTRFAAVGLAATAIQYLILIVAVEIFGSSAAVGSGVGYVMSSAANYSLNYRFTFDSTRAHTSALSRFIVVSLVGLLLSVALMTLFAGYWRTPYLLAQVVVTAITLIWNFIGSALWSFASPPAVTIDPTSRSP
jgi:putative flippase GtrA